MVDVWPEPRRGDGAEAGIVISSEATQSITAAARVIGPLTTCCEIARVLAALCEYMDEDDRAIMAFELNRLAGALLQQRQLH